MLSRDNIESIQRWSGFLGVVFIITGAINTFIGLFAFVIGAIPGIITIVLGVKLRGVKKYAKEYLETNNDGAVDLLMSELSSYLKIQGIMMIISLILGIIGGIAVGLSAPF